LNAKFNAIIIFAMPLLFGELILLFCS